MEERVKENNYKTKSTHNLEPRTDNPQPITDNKKYEPNDKYHSNDSSGSFPNERTNSC